VIMKGTFYRLAEGLQTILWNVLPPSSSSKMKPNAQAAGSLLAKF
jgi:hypothetical protein